MIEIDHIADSLLKLHIKIGVHLIIVELSQLLTLSVVFFYDLILCIFNLCSQMHLCLEI